MSSAAVLQTTKIGQLSEGQKSRLVFGMICMQRPNLLLLDEPTNHLDIESIDALADAIKAFNGGLVLVSHDFRLIDQVSPVAAPSPDCTCRSLQDMPVLHCCTPGIEANMHARLLTGSALGCTLLGLGIVEMHCVMKRVCATGGRGHLGM